VFPTWNSQLDDRSKRIFPATASFFQSSQLSGTHWSLSFQLFWTWQKSYRFDSVVNVFNLFCPMTLRVNVSPFKIGKETLKLRLGPHTLSTK
jgi:hypothetical protein